MKFFPKSGFLLLLCVALVQFAKSDTFKSSFSEYTRIWAGPDYWSNRLQDWRVHMNRLECLNGDSDKPVRTTHWISGDISDNQGAFSIEIRTGTLGNAPKSDGTAWSGILVGAGAGELDYRAAALIHHHPGLGGGILAVFDDQGRARILSNESEEPNVRPVLASSPNPNPPIDREGGFGKHEDFRLLLTATAVANGTRTLTLNISDYQSGKQIARAELPNIPAEKLRGGIAMASHGGKTSKRRFWFRDFKASGESIANHPKRRYGPILGTLYSRSGSVLKLTAQFPPLGFGDETEVALEIRTNDSRTWKTIAKEEIEAPSYSALFRVENFKAEGDIAFRIRYRFEGNPEYYHGRITADPNPGEEIKIAGLTCYQVMARPADGGWGDGFAGSPDGRWTPKNLWFPHNNLINDLKKHQPNLIALLGDQIYEAGNPTNSDSSQGNPNLDYLYKWYLTIWDLGRITRNFPSVALTDDHDIFQGDLWGDGGTPSQNGKNKDGGYIHEPEFIRMVERTQTGANPDPSSNVPLQQGLTSYYTAFQLGDIDIALIEDRKFKSMPTLIGPIAKNGSKIIDDNFDAAAADIPEGQLLGAAQEAFLESWVRTNPKRVKIGLTQTTYASFHTDPSGKRWPDLDSGGWPQSGRNRAINLLSQGHVLLMCGDTHLPSVIRHGVEKHGDGIWQFTVPAIANKYRRWWTPKESGANRLPDSPLYSGEYKDGFGNRITVAAVGNPDISNYDIFLENQRRGKGYASEHLLLDAAVTKDGYGLIIVSPDRKTVTLECWPVGRKDSSVVTQHEDWPILLGRESNNEKWSIQNKDITEK